MHFSKHSIVLFIILFCLFNCKNDDDTTNDTPISLTSNIEVYDADKIDNSLTLAVVKGAKYAFLVDKEGNKKYEWEFEDYLGNDLEIMPNGKLIGIFKDENPQITFGGYGGTLKIINSDNTIAWEYTISSPDYISHHDIEMLPNGNVLFLVWEKMEEAIAEQNGAVSSGTIYPEKLIEINPNTNQIVWEWRSWDHIIQDNDSSFPNYGVVSENPQLININYNTAPNGDIMHANGIDYDNTKDVIFISINFFNEIWVIDHSTSTLEASTHSGGNYNKGGDLIYRFGNPLAYDNLQGEKRFDRNHFPNLLEDGVPGEGNLLVYVNGKSENKSKIYELELPEIFNLLPNTDNEPLVAWEFQNEALYDDNISGAVRLENGNTLICEGDYGIWEVTPDKEVVWKYNNFGEELWRCYNYAVNAEELSYYNLMD
ncbi:MAG: aryl-sulfate sulfotransferase [Oceanihabitans sp.]|nr:aryl-sulfate sulfotransferase [Oceanihabitans sp.]